jgi:hypothetical protein
LTLSAKRGILASAKRQGAKMDAKMVQIIEAIWEVQKRLSTIVEGRSSKVLFAIYFALHLTLLAVIISLVLVRWIALEINSKVSAKMDLTFSTN